MQSKSWNLTPKQVKLPPGSSSDDTHPGNPAVCLVSASDYVWLLYDPKDCSLPGSSVHGIFQARIVEWVGHFLLQGIFPSQRSKPRLLNWQAVFFTTEPPGKPWNPGNTGNIPGPRRGQGRFPTHGLHWGPSIHCQRGEWQSPRRIPAIPTNAKWIRERCSYCALPKLVAQSLSRAWLFATPWTAARQASLSFTISLSFLKLMSIESAMPSSYVILYHPLLLLPSIFPRIRVFSNDSALHTRWPKCWSFSFSISPSSEYSGLISLKSKGLLRVFSNTTIQKHQLFGTQSSL